MQLKSFTLAVLLLVYGANAHGCDGKGAENLVSQMEYYNSLLNSYANLGEQVLLVTESSKSTKHLVQRDVNEAHQHNKHHHVIKNAHHHHHEDKEEQNLIAGSGNGEHAHAKHAHNEQLKLHKANIKNLWNQLNAQQTHLDSLTDTCIPLTHKLKVASSLKNLLTTYIVQEKNLKAAGKMVVEHKKSKKNRLSKKAKRDLVNRATHPSQAGWLTMGDDVNKGLNGNEKALTSKSTSTTIAATSTATNEPLLGNYGYVAPYRGNYPQFSPSLVTVVSTATPAPHEANKSSDTSSDSGSDNSSDSEAEGEGAQGNTASTPTAPAASQPSQHHHNIIIRTIGGTFHLITGTLHFVEHLLGFGRSSSSNALATGGSTSKDETTGITGEIHKLMEKIVDKYIH